MSTNDDCITENLSSYLYRQKYYKLIGIDLSRQTNASVPKQINFAEKLKKEYGAFYCWKVANNYFKPFFRFIIPTE